MGGGFGVGRGWVVGGKGLDVKGSCVGFFHIHIDPAGSVFSPCIKGRLITQNRTNKEIFLDRQKVNIRS